MSDRAPDRTIRVYIMQRPGIVTTIDVEGVSEVRYDAANQHNGKPDMMVLDRYRAATSQYRPVAEFILAEVAGWADLERVTQSGDGS